MATVIQMCRHLKAMCMYERVRDLSASVYISNQFNVYSGNAFWISGRLTTLLLRFPVVSLAPLGKCQDTSSDYTTTSFYIFTNSSLTTVTFNTVQQIKHFFNIPTKYTSLFLIHVSITSLLHVLMCYIHHLQGEPPITCIKPSAFYCVLCMSHWLCYTQHKAYCVYPWLINALPQLCVS